MNEDPVLLITGASSGIGAATARRAAEEGYRVALAARSREKLDDLAAEIGAERSLALRCDVTEWEQQQAAIDETIGRFGRLDAVFANAGFGAKAGLENETPDVWREMLMTNVLGVALTVRASLPALRESRGHILLAGSVAGRIHISGSMYSVSKWAVTALAESARLDLDGTGIRVTVIEPGYVQSPFWGKELEIDALRVEDVADAALFALTRPARVDVNEVLIRPVAQSP